MKISCDVARDLLPLYAENLVSRDSAALVEEHLAACADCRAQLTELRRQPPAAQPDGGADLKRLRTAIRRRRWRAVLLALLTASALFLSVFIYWNMPCFLTPEEAVAAVREESGEITVEFTGNVQTYSLDVFQAPDNGGGEAVIMCAEFPAGKLFERLTGSLPGLRTVTLPAGVERVWFSSGKETEDALLWGEPADFGQTTLPRLVMGYYFCIALALGGALLVLSVVFRKKKAGRWLFSGGAYFAGFALADWIATHGRFTTYDAPATLLTAGVLALFFFGIGFLAWETLRLYRQDRM